MVVVADVILHHNKVLYIDMTTDRNINTYTQTDRHKQAPTHPYIHTHDDNAVLTVTLVMAIKQGSRTRYK